MSLACPPRRTPLAAALGYHAFALGPVAVTVALLLGLERLVGVDLPLLGWLIGLLCVRQVSVFVVTALYHRSMSHGSVTFHPALEAALRLWGWLFTGLGVRTWALVHRWHHATGDGPDGPFSPSRPGGSLATIGRETLSAHWRVVREPASCARFAAGLPDDALERFVQAEERRFFGLLGVRTLVLLGLGTALGSAALGLTAPVALALTLGSLPAAMGSVASGAVLAVNGIGHLAGWRNFDTRDSSYNVVARDWIGMGEALHNNHHARPGSARFAVAPGEWDLTFLVLRALHRVGAVTRLVYDPEPVGAVPEPPPSQS